MTVEFLDGPQAGDASRTVVSPETYPRNGPGFDPLGVAPELKAPCR